MSVKKKCEWLITNKSFGKWGDSLLSTKLKEDLTELSINRIKIFLRLEQCDLTYSLERVKRME